MRRANRRARHFDRDRGARGVGTSQHRTRHDDGGYYAQRGDRVDGRSSDSTGRRTSDLDRGRHRQAFGSGAQLVTLPRLSSLNRKLLRDLLLMKGQVVAIAMVVAAGVAMYVMYLSNFESLRRTQRAYYERQRFGD